MESEPDRALIGTNRMMMRWNATQPGDAATDQAQSPGGEDLLARVAAQMPVELAMAIAQDTADAIAAFVREHPQLRDPVFMITQRQRGNAFVQAVLAAVTTMHKHPVNSPGEPAPEPHAAPAPAPAPTAPTAAPDAATTKGLDRRKTAGWEQIAHGGINDDRFAPSEIRLPSSAVTAIEC